jgi:hypothetical protein
MEDKMPSSMSINYSKIEGMLGDMKDDPRQLCKHHKKKTKKGSVNENILLSEESLKENKNDSNTVKSSESNKCKFYCNFCEEPVCLKCIQEGPHNTFVHQIIKIERAAENKMQILRQKINSTILKERQELLKEIEIANYLQNSVLVNVFKDINEQMAKDFWSKIGSTERFVNEQVNF